MHRQFTRLTSVLLALLGVAMLAATIAQGGGPLSLGIVLGLLFVGAGAGRLYVLRDDGEEEEG